jgi:hypothetical protein
MTKPDLDHLVRLARRERPPSGALEAVASNLRVPFVVAPATAALLPSSALAAAVSKLGVSTWSVGSALVVAGGVAALTLGTSPPASVHAPAVVAPAIVSAQVPKRPTPALLAAEPEAPPPQSNSERQKPRGAPAPWDEPQLIERARKALGTDPKRALSLTQEYQRRFPSGALAVEREVIALEALARLGQVAEARRRAVAFEARHPSSIHLPRVRSLLAKLGNP